MKPETAHLLGLAARSLIDGRPLLNLPARAFAYKSWADYGEQQAPDLNLVPDLLDDAELLFRKTCGLVGADAAALILAAERESRP